MKTRQKRRHRLLAFLLSVVTVLTTIFSSGSVAMAADGTIVFNSGETVPYGDYFTTKMTFDGANMAYCVEPLKYTPQAGSYSYDLLGNDSPVRKALYYLQGGYGYEANIKNQYLGGWTENDAYVIGHLVVAYIYAGYDAGSGAFHGAPQSFIDKALEVTGAIDGLPAPPKAFRAFLVPSNNSQTIAGSWYQVPYGYIEIRKSTANEGVSEGNGNYSLAGAEYGIFKGDSQVGTLVTDENGYAKSEALEVLEGAAYVVRELKASPGFAIDPDSYNVEVKPEVTAALDVREVPQNDPIALVLQKLDAETKEGKPQGAASLQGAEFTMKYYTVQSDTDPAAAGASPERTWVFRTDADGKIQFTKDYLVSGDDFYYQMDGSTPCIPLGTVTTQESKSPEGYLKTDTVFVQKIVAGGNVETVECYNPSAVEEQVYRGDLEFVKVSDGDLNRLANVPFAITSKKTGESHTLVTDKNGYANTASKWNPHTANTNRGETSKDGIWFGSSAPDDRKGALIYDTYTIEEQRCKTNEGMNLLKFDVTIYKDSVTVDLGTLTDDQVSIATTAIDKETGSHHSKPDEKVTLVDTVEYENLKKGKEYKVTGTLMDQETGEAVQIDGKPVTAETTFTAKKSNGSVEVTFTFDGSTLKGKTVVVFEELYQEKVKLAVHADIHDADQTIYFPEIGTTVKDGETGEHFSGADQEVTLIDTVAYQNLIPGKEYRVIGTLMDRKTEKAIQVEERPVTAEAVFTPKEAKGTVDVTFVFDGSVLKGKTVVVFESVQYEGKEIAVHGDITDEGQTIYFPEIKTTAKDSETGGHVSSPDETVTLTDTVAYTNLVPGKEYKVTGTLMDKETGKPLEVDEKEVTAEAVFTPKEAEGSVELSFTFAGSTLAGKTIVAFETLTYQEKEVAVHADLEDKDQTIYFPKIQTTAKDGADGDKELRAGAEVTIVDTVFYQNLETGKTYRVKGVLMDKATGKELLVNGKSVTAETEFQPKESTGTVDVTFTFDGTGLEGKSLVVFEKLYDADGKEEVLLVSHEEIGDEGQTVTFAEKEKPKTPDTPKTPDISKGTPKTGDDSNVGAWIALAGIAAAGAALFGALAVRRRKKNRKEE